MTETLLRSFDNQRVSWLEQVSIKVNELMTVMEIRQQIVCKEDDMANWGVKYAERNAGNNCEVCLFA